VSKEEIEKLQEDLASEIKLNADLRQLNADQKKSNEGLEQKLAEATVLNKELEQETEDLNAKLSELENNPSKAAAKPVLKIGKDSYQVMIPRVSLLDGTVVTVADLKENKLKVGEKKICDHLVEIKSGMLLKIEAS
jgi:hypothetical protein